MTSLLKILKNDAFVVSENVVEIPDIALDDLRKGKRHTADDHVNQSEQNLEDNDSAEDAAKALMEQALRQIEKERQEMLSKTKIECEHLRQLAYDEGYNEAYQSKVSELENGLLSASSALDQITHQISDYMTQYEQNLHILAMDIAAKILAKKIEKDDSDMLELVKHGMDSVKHAEWLSVTLSDKAERLYTALAEELKSGIENKRVQIQVKDLPVGACIIETPSGVLDISISEQLENLKACFG